MATDLPNTQIATGTITGTFVHGDGTPASGSVTFVPSAEVTGLGGVMVPCAVTVTLTNGTFSEVLAATGQTGLLPVGWVWNVYECTDCGKRSYQIQLAAGTTVDLSTQGAIPPAGVGLYADLQNLAPPVTGMPVMMVVSGRSTLGDGGAGTFVWSPGNESANVTADPTQGVWVAPASAPTGAGGAWRRIYNAGLSPLWFGAKGDGVTNDAAAFQAVGTMLTALAEAGSIFVPAMSYVIDTTVNWNLPQGSVVEAYGATFTTPNDTVVFDINPVATAAGSGATSSADVKRNIKFLGGSFFCTAVTVTTGCAIQAYFMRNVVIADVYATGFFAGFRFGCLDTYRFRNNYIFNCQYGFLIPPAGTVGSPTDTSGIETIDCRIEGCNISCASMKGAIWVRDQVVNFVVAGGNINGATTQAQVQFEDPAAPRGLTIGVAIDGVHFEQQWNSLYCINFNGNGGQGFYNCRVGGGCSIVANPPAGQTAAGCGLRLVNCKSFTVGNAFFNCGSSSGGGIGVYVDEPSCGAIDLEPTANFYATQTKVFLNGSGAAITRNGAPPMHRPMSLTGYSNATVSTTARTTLTVASLYSPFAPPFCTPKGYLVEVTFSDSGSAGVTSGCNVTVQTPSGGSSPSSLVVQNFGLVNGTTNTKTGAIGADANGNFDVTINTTGTGTGLLTIAIVAEIPI